MVYLHVCVLHQPPPPSRHMNNGIHDPMGGVKYIHSSRLVKECTFNCAIKFFEVQWYWWM